MAKNRSDALAKFDSSGFVYVEADEVTSFLYDFAYFTKANCRAYMKEACLDLQIYMKNNRPWNDRTGNARRGLKAKFIDDYTPGPKFKALSVQLLHGVPYGVFLEFNGVHYRAYLKRQRPILVPTLKTEVPRVIRGMKNILKKLAW